MKKQLLLAGSILGGASVAIGAFGAHGLEKLLAPDALTTFETGVKYQMYHALLLLLIAGFPLAVKTKRILLILLVTGVVFFSGSIYGLATNSLTTFDFAKIALITPIGGTLLLISWGILLVQFTRLKTDK